ncbi:MAG: hypothetical protein HFG66_02335 [Hungatella sp.]|nr:hypothetical protein [Hungatella sp.]
MNIHNMLFVLENKTLFTQIMRKAKRKYFLSGKNVFDKQLKQLSFMLNYVNQHCRFYQNIQYKSIIDFPIIDKRILKERYDDFVSDISNRYLYADAYTGGSTGEPLHFLRSGGYEYEFEVKKWIKYGYRTGDRILALDGTKIEQSLISNNIFWKRVSQNELPYGSYAISSLYLTNKNIKMYIDFLISQGAEFWRGYPSFIYQIACYVINNNISFPKMKGIELTSETSYEFQIQKIKEAFDVPVYLQYGHSEACIFGYTYDESYRYKMEPLYGYVEVLNTNGQQVKVGEIGEVVVTSLHNYVMPLIRYRTGDYAVWGGIDERYCYLNSVLGRTQDYIISHKGEKVLLTALIFGQHFKALGNIRRWQIEQFTPGKIIIHIVKDYSYTIDDENEIRNLFSELGNVDIQFDYAKDIRLTSGGKSLMINQHITGL